MDRKRIMLVALVGAAGLGVSACAGDYGYGGMSVGYGPGYYDSYDPGYWGWYGDYYYPGTGVYVYDHYRRPYRWNDDQRRYWEGRGNNYWHNRPGGNGNGAGPRPNPRPNWHDFHNRGGGNFGGRGPRGGPPPHR